MKKLPLFLLVLLLSPVVAFSQGTLSGTISDGESGDVLPGANIIVVGENLGAAAGLDGTYSITGIPVGTYTIRVTFIGYKQIDQEVSIASGDNTLNVSLDPDFTGLEEVVVTGIASATSKARAEVAVSSLSTDKLLEQNAYQDVSQLLNGKIPGVSVQPSSGNVGGGIRFNMRSSTGLNGGGQPVIYIDGVRIDASEVGGFSAGGQDVSMLSSINPEEIASVEVLKGPAGAALYGTSGSNGVVLITTKRGSLSSADRPFTINYKGVLGTNSQFQEYDQFTAGTPETANAFFRDGDIEQHSINVSGGSARVRYFASYDNRFEEGHMRNNKLERQSFRANFEAFPMENLTVRANTGYTLNDINRPQNDNNIFGYLGNTLLASSPFVFTDSLAIEGVANIQRISRFIGTAEIEYRPIENLTLRGSIGFDGTDLRNDESFPSNLSYSGRTNGERNILNRRNEQYTYDFNARYAYDLGSSGLTGTTIIGSQSFNRILRNFNFTKQNFSSELVTNVGAGADFIGGDEGFLHVREAGVYAQQEFAFNNWLFATLGARQDFASAVGADAPSIFYPKASFAVRVDQVASMPSFINFFKVRAAYGETGQLPGNLDGSLLRWAAEPSGYGAGAVTSFIGNIEIEPERIKELEGGIELGMLNDRIGLELTGYLQKAEDSIIGFQNAPSSGQTASSVPFNVGASTGWGIESSLVVDVVRQRNYGVDLAIIWNYQENEVDDLGDAQPIFSGFDTNVIKEGLPKDAFYTWSSRATFNDDGSYAGAELTTTDVDGDGEPDRAFFGLPYPKHNGSVTLNVRFLRDFTFSGLLDWQLGNSVYNNTHLFSRRFGAFFKRNEALVNIGQVTADQVGLEDDNIPVYDVGTEDYRRAAEVVAGTEFSLQGVDLDGNWIEKADFVKLREISVRYDFTNLMRKANITRYVRSASFTLSARNLWMSTTYSGMDPEVNFTGAISSTRASDFLTLPQPRVIYGTLTIGL
ncbi:MAG: TonB-dependent receptor [Rhodothermaceae bacterium]|nr:TonB-dependent receptor [Rhodothermaceae bacterium]